MIDETCATEERKSQRQFLHITNLSMDDDMKEVHIFEAVISPSHQQIKLTQKHNKQQKITVMIINHNPKIPC